MSIEFLDRRQKKTAILLISPETGRLPDRMRPLAGFISGKSAIAVDEFSTLCVGADTTGWLIQRGCRLGASMARWKESF
jgi:hypothetical protein